MMRTTPLMLLFVNCACSLRVLGHMTERAHASRALNLRMVAKNMAGVQTQQEVFYYEQDKDEFASAKPESSFVLGATNFRKQGGSIFVQLAENVGLREKNKFQPPECLGLALSNEAVRARDVLVTTCRGPV